MNTHKYTHTLTYAHTHTHTHTYTHTHTHTQDSSAVADECLGSMKTVKSLGAEKEMVEPFCYF
jgi:hypothetical protein